MKIKSENGVMLLGVGALLVAILFVSLGIYTYNSANSTIVTSQDKISSEKNDIYNGRLKPYIGESVKGSEVKALIDTVISQNQTCIDEDGMFISISAEDITNYDGESSLDSACLDAQYENNAENVKEATNEMHKLKTKINSQKNFEVTAEYESGRITQLNIRSRGAE